ncbi:hypothetical protein LTR97_006403 [Elasticomyces elasticus]|uniref:DUF8212 domain-containing protein n=1 Tax=Elasticomyces elasticus TaxID=574655 RepID=A0AAN8A1M1_9PEZI|nr:hypothetical protein LTR97_006403 [Elasticomyces elasticus]
MTRRGGDTASEWFSRGWTLQELLAPRDLLFCDATWKPIALLRKDSAEQTDNGLVALLSEFTGIPERFLASNNRFTEASIAQKMSWMAERSTTRVEDMAYCLLGLFGIDMPPLYGEGKRAFIRLQKEIIQRSDDESIFAWRNDWAHVYRDHYYDGRREGCFRPGLLATEPKDFRECGNIAPVEPNLRPPYRITNRGLEFSSRTIFIHLDGETDRWQTCLVRLACAETIGGVANQCLIALRCAQETHGVSAGRLLAVGREYVCDTRGRLHNTHHDAMHRHGLLDMEGTGEQQLFYIKLS